MSRKKIAMFLAVALFVSAAIVGILTPSPAEAWQYSPRLKKFVQALPMPGPNGIPLATPDKTTYPGVDYYQMSVRSYNQKLHPDLPPTTLFGYTDITNKNTVPVSKHLGGIIIAQKNRPVRLSFVDDLPLQHIMPVDTTIPGSGMGQLKNRVAVHLHGGAVPWPSDGGPFHWFAPNGSQGISFERWLPDAVGNLTNDLWYPNKLESARLMWYHDHAVGNTRINAYSGLASAYILRDARELAMVAQGMPNLVEKGGREIPIVIQDKIFSPNGALWYPSVYDPLRWQLNGAPPIPSAVPEFSGDTMLANGVVYPYHNVEPRRYRLRILNACNTRFMNLQIKNARGVAFPLSTEPDLTPAGVGPNFLQIGNEGGFLAAPAPKANLLMGPAVRSDVIVDFSGVAPGSFLILYNDAPSPYPNAAPPPAPSYDFFPGNPDNPFSGPMGYGPNTRTIMQFRVGNLNGLPDPPMNLVLPAMDPVPIVTPVANTVLPDPVGAVHRYITLNERSDSYGRLIQELGNLTLNPATGGYGKMYLDPPSETPAAGSVEVWHFLNLTGDTHPMHIHLANGQILRRQAFDALNFAGAPFYFPPLVPPDPDELGWKETFHCPPGVDTVVAIRFDLPPNPRYKINGVLTTVPVPFSARTGGYEYVYHCHILEHEEHDMMRPEVIF